MIPSVVRIELRAQSPTSRPQGFGKKGSAVTSPTTGPVPATLGEWSLTSVEALCAAGYGESDRHDFKFGLPDPKGLTKLACAFANTFGGFVALGVRENSAHQFEPIGIDPDGEIYGKFHDKIRAEPEIGVSYPLQLAVTGTSKVVYVFEILQSTRRPHLPAPAEERIFWKRVGSDCRQMTLEEVRYQMLTLEEKREKLALLLIDLSHKLRTVSQHAQMADGYYNGDIFSFDIIDRVVVESYSVLRDDLNTIGVLDSLKGRFALLNAEKQMLLSFMSLSYSLDSKQAKIKEYRELARQHLPGITVIVEQVEKSFAEKFGILNPYKQRI